MPFDYTTKGWPASLTLNGQVYAVLSCDDGDIGLMYKQAGVKNPHVTIHRADKEGPGTWRRSGGFHVVITNTKKFEFTSDGTPHDFMTPAKSRGGSKAVTGHGDAEQTATAKAIAMDFSAAIWNAVKGD
jgi:hypothetical protein